MAKPRVIIADTEISYITPLQHKFIKEFFNKIDLEVITDKNYFEQLFTEPQEAAIVVVSDDMYAPFIKKHNIMNVFLMTEKQEGGQDSDNVNRLFKYSSIKEIFNTIVGKSKGVFENGIIEETKTILVTSANGGTGKTTVAMGVSACLAKNYKKVLYINSSRLQSFQYLLKNETAVSLSDIYAKLSNPTENIYSDIKHIIRNELFSYLPPFRAALMSVGLDYSIFRKIAVSAKKSGEYDFIIIDAENTFDDEKINLLDEADKVIIITEQNMESVIAANTLISNINSIDSEKYMFICNKFEKEKYNALAASDISLKFNVSEYIDKFIIDGKIEIEELSQNNGIKSVMILLI